MIKIVKNLGNGRLNNLNDPVLNVLNSPITEVTQPKGHTVSDCTNCGVIGSNPPREVDGWMDGGFCVPVCLLR